MLLLINGPPGIGKSTIARRYAADHPRALVVEIDDLRTRLGGWAADEESKRLARDLAVDLIEGHLRRGYDAVIPQYLGRPEFRDRLAALATAHSVPFVEVVLVAPAGVAESRFRDRRTALAGADHPEADVPDDAITAAVHDATTRLTSGARTAARLVVDASGGVDATYDAVARALGGRDTAER